MWAIYTIAFVLEKKKTVKISVKCCVLATAISLPVCIYLSLTTVRFLTRSQDL